HAPLPLLALHPLPTRRSSDLRRVSRAGADSVLADTPPQGEGYAMHDLPRGEPLVPERGREEALDVVACPQGEPALRNEGFTSGRSEEHTSELQSRFDLVCRLL